MDYKRQRQDIRRLERHFRRSYKSNEQSNQTLGASEEVAKESAMSLEQTLKKILPAYMMPTNVGDINTVSWPFYHVVDFDFGADPTYGPNTRQTQSFQVTQEAAFVMTKLSMKTFDDSDAGELAPLSLRIVDRQSSRQFTDGLLPIQMIGSKSYPTVFPTPMLIMPNAFMDFTLESWLTSNQATTGVGKFQLMVEGYRIRIGDMNKVLSTVFG